VYEAPYTRCPGNRVGKLSYDWSTATLWKGPIKRAIFTIDCSGVGGIKNAGAEVLSTPGVWPLIIGDNVMCFEVSDFQPLFERALIIFVQPDKR
jgi:hypothetical protein